MFKEENKNTARPLPDRMRPENFSDFFGQEEIVGAGKLLRKLIETDQLSSLIFWGPPGSGKTTLAHIIAGQTNANFIKISAVMSGKEELRKAIDKAQEMLRVENRKTILFVDEIHRWNKAQQDALLPYVENGEIILIGATTENPSFEIIGALLSRSRVFILKKLENEAVVQILKCSLLDKERGLGNYKIEINDEVLNFLAELSGGDARTALNGLELAFKAKAKKDFKNKIELTLDNIKEALQRTHLVFDKKGEEFYNLISALHKSMRGSDANAALYWLARMFEGGADPLYIARRILRFASEDIGVADSRALLIANAAYDACHKLGYPECNVHLAEAVVYCAMAKKSNLLYTGYLKAADDARKTSHLGVPLHLRNAPTKFMKEIGYSKGYKYPPASQARALRAGNPDFKGQVEQEYLPAEIRNHKYLE